MNENWKPGDIALIDTGSGFEAVGLRAGIASNMGWAYTASESSGAPLKYGNCWTSDRNGAAAIRRLVVIDPEDKTGDLSRLWRLLSNHLVSVDQLQAAFREFANPTPPKPEEPLGLGAVVEDAEGVRYVRHCMGDDQTTWCDPNGIGRPWSRINVVKVLSEGVTP